jgi:hypothetical protein
MHEIQTLDFIQCLNFGGSGTTKSEMVAMYMELKDMPPTGFILVLGSRPSLLHKPVPALTVPERLVKVIQHFIIPLAASPWSSGAKGF